MSSYRVSIRDAKQTVEFLVSSRTQKLKKEVIRRAQGAGEQIVKKVQDTLKGTRSGRLYGKHRASAPGEPPAVDTGSLRNSFKAKNKITDEGGGVTKIKSYTYSNLAKDGVSPGYNYAWIDEGNARIEPRPYREEAGKQAFDLIKKNLKRPYNV